MRIKRAMKSKYPGEVKEPITDGNNVVFMERKGPNLPLFSSGNHSDRILPLIIDMLFHKHHLFALAMRSRDTRRQEQRHTNRETSEEQV